MNITPERNKIIKYLTYADTIASTKSTIPVLSNILIDAEEDQISIYSSNLETGIKIVYPMETDQQGSIAVNGKKLLGVIRELPDDLVILKADEQNRLTVTGASEKINAKFVISGLPKSDFPEVNTEPESEFFRLNFEEFKNMIRKVIFSISTDENKYALTGVFMEKQDGNINMVATDGKRLSLITRSGEQLDITSDELPVPEEGVIVPKMVFTEIMKYSSENNELYMGCSKNQIFFMYDNINLMSNLIEGRFPDFKKIIPQERESFFTVNRELLYSAIRRVSILVDENYNQIKLSLSPDKLLVTSSNPTLGGAAEEIPINYQGEDLDIALNYTYMLDCLKELNSDTVKIDFEDSERVVRIRGEGDIGYINLVMPMKTNL